MISMERNRQRTARSPRALKGVARIHKALEAALVVIDREIGDEVRGPPVWRATEDLLTSVPGVGRITARRLIAESSELGSTGRRRLAALVEAASLNAPRGVHGRRHPPLAGTAHPRLYLRLRVCGRPAKAALVAAMRKLLTILTAILRDAKPWQNA